MQIKNVFRRKSKRWGGSGIQILLNRKKLYTSSRLQLQTLPRLLNLVYVNGVDGAEGGARIIAMHCRLSLAPFCICMISFFLCEGWRQNLAPESLLSPLVSIPGPNVGKDRVRGEASDSSPPPPPPSSTTWAAPTTTPLPPSVLSSPKDLIGMLCIPGKVCPLWCQRCAQGGWEFPITHFFENVDNF